MITNFLFPNRCLECNSIIDPKVLICESCFPKIPFTHLNFDDNHDLKQRCKLLFPVEGSYGLLDYEEEGPSRKIIHALKYRRREIVGEILAQWTIERFNFKKIRPDLIASVPLHPKKLRERGYNQLDKFSETLSKHFELPYDKDLVKRNYYSRPQALKRKLHRINTQNLFSITKAIENQHVLLIDDVYTTGNTISSMAWEILKSGNNKVSILVMAIDS